MLLIIVNIIYKCWGFEISNNFFEIVNNLYCIFCSSKIGLIIYFENSLPIWFMCIVEKLSRLK